MKYKKLLISNMFKEYSVLEVNKECYDNSPNIEQAGLMMGIKIKDDSHLKFMIKECKNKGFKLENYIQHLIDGTC